MIYFDNSATTLQKPNSVYTALKGIGELGNAGRSFYAPAVNASKTILNARREIAKLVGANSPMNIAFTSNATESLNLVLNSLITKESKVLTTVLEHNSVLRPLYQIGCELEFIDCDEKGNLDYELEKYNDIDFMVVTHGSNVIGNITDVKNLYEQCKEKNIIFIIDASQTLGSIEVNVDMADVICFTGHKSLFGLQGTGGVIANENIHFNVVKTGGAGSNSFDRTQLTTMPDVFEVGTMNAHGLASLVEGVKYVNEFGIREIEAHHSRLSHRLIDGLKRIPKVILYGDVDVEKRLPVVSFNIGSTPSDDTAFKLWDEYEIASRSGAHCAPLLHTHFGTVEQGMVRLSMSLFNTIDEVDIVLNAIEELARR